MAVLAQTTETYDVSTIRQDLSQAYSSISPEETPFQTLIGTSTPATATYHEWTVVNLANADASNRVAEGEDAPAVDVGTFAMRRGNYTQISDKQVSVSDTAEAVDGAAENIQTMSKQIALKIAELKRDMEVMLMSNVSALAGSTGVARRSAGLPAFLRTNIVLGAGGAAPTLSGTTEGFPNAAATPGTAVAITETGFGDVIQQVWNQGGRVTTVMVNGNNKRTISRTFTGNSTRYKDAIDKRLSASVDVYDSDFGELSIVPNPHQPTVAASTYAVYFIDPKLVSVSFLQPMKQRDIAVTGHSKKKLVWCEYTLQVDNEAGLGAMLATTGS